MAEITITKENFKQEVLEADKPVLVDFWATWCGPCQMLGPIIAQIAEEQELAVKFNVMSIPTLLVFKNGEVVNQGIGFMDKSRVDALLQ